MKVVVEQGKCIGAANCVRAARRVFGQRDEDGLVVLLQEHPAERDADDVRAAADLCPAQAIALIQDGETGVSAEG